MPVPTSLASLSETPGNNSPAPTETVGTIMNQYIQQAYAFIAMLYAGAMTPTAALNFNGQQINSVAAGVAQTDVAVVGQLPSPSGTRVVLQQAAAPTGWTVDTTATYTDAAMRFNQTVGNGGTAGLVASGWVSAGVFTSSGTALTIAQMPSHSHTDGGHNHGAFDSGHGHGVADPGHAHAMNLVNNQNLANPGSGAPSFGGGIITSNQPTNISIGTGFANINIGTGYANINNTGGGGTHTHTVTAPNIKYADCIVAIKS